MKGGRDRIQETLEWGYRKLITSKMNRRLNSDIHV